MANAQTFQSAVAEQQVSTMGDLLALGALMCGVMLGIQALLAFKRHAEQPANAPISKGIVLMFMSVGLICLPQFMQGAAPSLDDQPRVVAAKPLKEEALGENASEEASSEEVAALATVGKASAPTENASKEASSKEVAAWVSVKAGLSAESFALAEKTAARELEAKGLGMSAPAASQGVGDVGALAWGLGSLLALGVAGGAWARRASQRIRRETEAQAMPRVDLNAPRES